MFNDTESIVRKLKNMRLHSSEIFLVILVSPPLSSSIPVFGKILKGFRFFEPFIKIRGLIFLSGNQFKTFFPVISDISPKSTGRLIDSLPNLPLRACSIEETVKADIICTLTPAHQPVVQNIWLKPGTHINAVGADAEGKEELEPSILNDARVVVDDLRQAIHAGEINVPIARGIYKKEQIFATLGEIIAGYKQGRTNNEMITVFDSTGLAIEDIAVAGLVYRKARQNGAGVSLNLVD